MQADDDAFTQDDMAYFQGQQEQWIKAAPAVERDYARLAGKTGAWVAFKDGALAARALDGDVLEQQLRGKGLSLEQVLIRYLPPSGAILVY